MKVPAGEHEIRFKFDPTSYRVGEMISLVASLLIVLILFYGLYQWLTKAEPVTPVAVQEAKHASTTGTQKHADRKLLRKKKKP